MKSLLVTVILAIFVLALFLHSGSTLKCYNCDSTQCNKTITCGVSQDRCITIHYGLGNVYGCWRSSECNINSVSHTTTLNNFRFECCNWDLCNSAPPNVVASKVVLSGALLLTFVYMLKSLVWN